MKIKNILFFTLLKIDTLKTRGIYHDLMREFADHGHHVYIISPVERRHNKPSTLSSEGNVHFLTVETLNIQKTNIFEKGLATVLIERSFLSGFKKHFEHVKFDVVIYSTPPITFTKIINYIKEKDGAMSYLLLKDIFPQNAIDMGMMFKNGIIHRFFRNKERKLYQLSDYIGCMSEANVKYILAHNPTLKKSKVEINPNSIAPLPFTEPDAEQIKLIKKKYKLPLKKKIFIYGGNLGRPQGIDFLLETIALHKNDIRSYFLIVGSGTEYQKIREWFTLNKPKNAKLISGLPKAEYDSLIKVCDVGLIFLNKNFTIPNFPSRLLSYLEWKLPVLVAADPNTDIGTEVVKHNCGLSVLAGETEQMSKALDYFCTLNREDFNVLRSNARNYLEKNFLVSFSYEKIIKRLTIYKKTHHI